MRILYIGAEGRLEQTVRDAAYAAGKSVDVSVVDTGKLGVIRLLKDRSLHYVIIDCSLKDIRCAALIDFVVKDNIVRDSNIIVLSFHFSPAELKEFTKRNVRCVTYTIDLVSLKNDFESIFRSA
jgi:hypothetical protein